MGLRTRARPIATRCIWPPESWVAAIAQLVLDVQHARDLAHARASISAAGMRRAGERSGKARLSNTDRCGYSEYCWNTKATSRAAGVASVTSRPPIEHAARIGPLQPGDQAQGRRLARAGRAEQHHELAVGDGAGRDRAPRSVSPKRFETPWSRDLSHAPPPRAGACAMARPDCASNSDSLPA